MDYARIATTVTRLINKNGRNTILQKLSGEAADPDKPWKGAQEPSVETQLAIRGVFVPASGDSLGTEFVSNELLSRCTEVMLAGPNAADLSQFNSLLDNSIRWSVQWVYALKPADTTLLYAIGVKR